MSARQNILDLVEEMRAKGEPFVLATVVRTVAATAAKAGAKAVIGADGSISCGWIGGGCARAAVLRAARQALADGQPHLVSILPTDFFEDAGLAPGDVRDGIEFAKNGCPSQGTMDVFIEPILPRPDLVILGSSPVAIALCDIARRLSFFVTVCAPAREHPEFGEVDRLVDGFDIPSERGHRRYVVVATQGKGDAAALEAALRVDFTHLAFVGSRRKAAVLTAGLIARELAPERVAAVKAPAGLDIGAITPDEIALSIMAEITEVRRRGQRSNAIIREPPGSTGTDPIIPNALTDKRRNAVTLIRKTRA